MIEEHQLEDIFLSGGMLDKAFDSFEKRDDQLEMAILASRVYNENINGVIEAGTGIGKSYAYLSVALLNALENKEDRTVIATSNVALQQQLMNKDIPTLENALDLSVPYALLLGRGRYVCFNRMMIIFGCQFFLHFDSSIRFLSKTKRSGQAGFFSFEPEFLQRK